MGELTSPPLLAPKDLTVLCLNSPVVAHLLQGTPEGFLFGDTPHDERRDLVAHMALQLIDILYCEGAVVDQRAPPRGKGLFEIEASRIIHSGDS